MPQSFPVITATTKLQDSLQPILDRDISARSNNSGTAFPTTDLELGMLCYRTDIGALYVLKQVTPTVTWEPLVQSTGAGGSFLALAGGIMVGSIGFTATAVERRITFTTGAGNNNTYLFGRPSDNVVGLYNSQNTTSVWEYTPANNTFNVAANNFTKGGNTVWHAGNDGAGSGLDADLLDGQDSAFYRNYTNLTNRPTLGTASAINTGDISAFVDLSSRVPLSGGTMTGNLRATAFRAAKGAPSGDGSMVGHSFAGDGDTGFFALDGSENSGTTQLGFFINGSQQVTLNTSGQLWASNYGWLHDYFARRPTAAGMGVTRTTNCAAGDTPTSFGYEVYDVGDGRHQVRYFRVNCTNCTPPPSACDCSCVVAGTPILLADGRHVAIEMLKAGDRLADGRGGAGVVIGLHRVALGHRRLIRVNGVTMSDDHPLLTTNGWAALDTEAVRRATEVMDRLIGVNRKVVSFYEAATDPGLHVLQPGNDLLTLDDVVAAEVEVIADADPWTPLYSPIVMGAGSFVTGNLISGALRLAGSAFSDS